MTSEATTIKNEREREKEGENEGGERDREWERMTRKE